MRRWRLASEKESWWGCRFSSSSTITAESWPAATHESEDGYKKCEPKERDAFKTESSQEEKRESKTSFVLFQCLRNPQGTRNGSTDGSNCVSGSAQPLSSCTWLQRHRVVLRVSQVSDGGRPSEAAQARLTLQATVSLHQAAERSVEPEHNTHNKASLVDAEQKWDQTVRGVRRRNSLHDDYIDPIHGDQDDCLPPETVNIHHSANDLI